MVPARGPGTPWEKLLGPVHEEVRLSLEVEGDVVRGAEGGLFVPHPAEAESSVEATIEATEAARHPGSDVLVAGDDLVGSLKARRHSQSGGGAVAHIAVSASAPRADTELE